jgi:hypothetical protein
MTDGSQPRNRVSTRTTPPSKPRSADRTGERRAAGVDTLSAAGLCAEVGDFARFPKPTGLSGFLGIVPSERTSDTKRRQGQITKAGPGHARRLLVEAAHHYRHPPRIGVTLGERQHGQDPRIIAVAWRAQRRLHDRWQHLDRHRRKPAGVVAIACAREPRSCGRPPRLTNPPPEPPRPGTLPGRARAPRRPTTAARGSRRYYGQPARPAGGARR